MITMKMIRRTRRTSIIGVTLICALLPVVIAICFAPCGIGHRVDREVSEGGSRTCAASGGQGNDRGKGLLGRGRDPSVRSSMLTSTRSIIGNSEGSSAPDLSSDFPRRLIIETWRSRAREISAFRVRGPTNRSVRCMAISVSPDRKPSHPREVFNHHAAPPKVETLRLRFGTAFSRLRISKARDARILSVGPSANHFVAETPTSPRGDITLLPGIVRTLRDSGPPSRLPAVPLQHRFADVS